MIWLILVLLLGLTLAFLLPVLNQPAPVSARDSLERELEASKNQLAQIKAEIESGFQDEESASRAQRAMERRILKLADRLAALKDGGSGALSPLIRFGVPALIVLGSLALYPVIGSPGFSRNTDPLEQLVRDLEKELHAMETPDPNGYVILARAKWGLGDLDGTIAAYKVALEASGGNEGIADELQVAEFEKKLTQMPETDPKGYVLLARAKLSLGNLDGSIEAYETALNASGGDADIAAELAQVMAYKAQQQAGNTGPDMNSEQAETIRNMTPEEQAAQINAMVDGLAARLEADPGDLQGWLRLIKARSVLGQTDQARADLASARAAFTGDAEANALLDQMETEITATRAE